VQVPDVRLPDSLEAVYEHFQTQGWGDGLPVVPPTEARVREMLRYTDHDPDEVIGLVPPGRGEASVLKVAVNAVMAGCRPEYLPVVLAAVRAMCQEPFNLYGIQTTTNPVTVAGFVNGPVVRALGFNAGWNCLGQGNRANATVGRAIRLVLVNIGGGRPGELDRATHGQPGKYSFFFAENEAENPWRPFHVECGFDPNVSTVTVVGASGTLNLLEPTDDADDLLRVFAASMRFPASNDYMFNGEPWLVLCPEHAAVLHRAGYDKEAVRAALWERTRQPFREFSKRAAHYWVTPTWRPLLGELTEDTLIPIADTPERIRIVVAGGPSIHSVYVPTFGDTRAVTVPITGRDGAPWRAFGQPVR
jgi:hypothetical protein